MASFLSNSPFALKTSQAVTIYTSEKMTFKIGLLLGAIFACVESGHIAAQDRGQAAMRARALEMFARSYYPGRSGQIMIVPREGVIVVSYKDPVVKFMHGSPWPYDTRIPLLLYGTPYIREGTFTALARQQDVMPTVARLLGLSVPPTVTGRPLTEALVAATLSPRVVLIAVLDGMRRDYFDRHAALLPTLTRLRDDGAWFANAEIDYLPTITGLGHTTVSSGTDPRYHGTTGNSMFDKVARKPQETYAGNSPRDFMVINLADAWNLHTSGRAVIIAQGSSGPAAIGLAGHGACLFGRNGCARPPTVVKAGRGHPTTPATICRRTRQREMCAKFGNKPAAPGWGMTLPTPMPFAARRYLPASKPTLCCR